MKDDGGPAETMVLANSMLQLDFTVEWPKCLAKARNYIHYNVFIIMVLNSFILFNQIICLR
jgi:hypothetical protein